MTEMDTSLSDSELISEVRDALAGIDSTKVPDATITQSADRFVIPLLNDISPPPDNNFDQDDFDNAVIAMTAERAFSAWMTYSRLRDREVEAYIDAKQYLNQLKERTNLALRQINSTRPSSIPNEVVTIKHDGVNRKVNLQKNWVFDE